MCNRESSFLHKEKIFRIKEPDAIFRSLSLDIEADEYECLYLIQNNKLCLYNLSVSSKLKQYPHINNLIPLICDGKAQYDRVELCLRYTGYINIFTKFMGFNFEEDHLSDYEEGFNLYFSEGLLQTSEEYSLETEGAVENEK